MLLEVFFNTYEINLQRTSCEMMKSSCKTLESLTNYSRFIFRRTFGTPCTSSDSMDNRGLIRNISWDTSHICGRSISSQPIQRNKRYSLFPVNKMHVDRYASGDVITNSYFWYLLLHQINVYCVEERWYDN